MPQMPPTVETSMPSVTDSAPMTATLRMPMRSASQPIGMPPMPVPSQASEEASAGTERGVASSSASCLRPTTMMRGAP